MSEKLFLIRIDMERFLGPMTLKEVREAYRRMEFGLQDEIASSNKAWVAFDDLERVKRHYPELTNLVKKEMLSGWGNTSHSSISITSEIKQKSIPKKTMGIAAKLGLIGAIALSSFFSVYLIKEQRWKDIKLFFKDPLLSRAALQFGDSYNPKFEAFMDSNREEINRSLKNKAVQDQWLPYVRAVAFGKNGTWTGLGTRGLKGKDAPFSPSDCSVKKWARKWKVVEGKISPMLSANATITQDWGRILFWDVEWIQQRIGAKRGWMWPSSYYEACIISSIQSLKVLKNDEKDPWEKQVVESRLKWLLNLLNGEDTNEEYQMSGVLWSMSCIETSEIGDKLENCLKAIRPNKEWGAYLVHRMNLRQARLLLYENSSLDQDELQKLKNYTNKILDKDPLTRFEYGQEKALFQKIIEMQGNVQQAVKTINSQRKNVRFRY